jgi:hypothetical protein
MTDLASTDLTYSFKPRDRTFLGKAGYLNIGTITFGDAALTVPSANFDPLKSSNQQQLVILSSMTSQLPR